jgi:hypothetical protein
VAVEVSLQPWRAFQPDGVILFSDILTPIAGMNIPFDIDKGKGPVIADPIRTMAVSGGACGTASAGFFVCVCVCVCWGGGGTQALLAHPYSCTNCRADARRSIHTACRKHVDNRELAHFC